MRLADFKHHVTYSTKLSAGETYDRLLSVTAPYTTFTSSLNFEYSNKKYQGDMASEGFVLLERGSKSVASAPEVKGSFEFGDTHSLIHLKLSPHPMGILMVLILLFIFIPVGVMVIKDEMQKPAFAMNTLWFLVFPILLLTAVIATYLYNVYSMKKHLKELLEAEDVNA